MASGYDFKKEEDVKAFIRNLGIEYRYGCYRENNAEACHLLGDYLESVEKKPEQAYELYKRNCDENNFGHSCRKYAAHLIKGSKIDDLAQLTLSTEYSSKGCELGRLDSCVLAGKCGLKLIADTNKSAPESAYSKYIDYLVRSCASEHSKQDEGCFILGSFYLNMLSFQKAVDPLIKSCDMENPFACANLSLMYRKGDGVERSPELEEKYREKAKEIWKDMTKEKPRTKFQEGLETS